MPPNCEPSIASTKPIKTLSKSILLMIVSEEVTLLSNKKLFIWVSVNNSCKIRFFIPSLISSNLSRITPDPYKRGIFSNNICIANQFVMLPDRANTPVIIMN